jgi:hypothetical protein
VGRKGIVSKLTDGLQILTDAVLTIGRECVAHDKGFPCIYMYCKLMHNIWIEAESPATSCVAVFCVYTCSALVVFLFPI